MQRFAILLQRLVKEGGHDVRLVRPPAVLGRFARDHNEQDRWLGYVDRFLLYRRSLQVAARWAEVVHICDQANAVYVPLLQGIPSVITCHDLLAIRSALGEDPEHSTRWSGRIYQRWILNGLRQATRVVCVSSRSRADLLRLTRVPPERTSLVYNALNHAYRAIDEPTARAQLRAQGVPDVQPFFLHVGSNVWYKNRVGVVRLFHRLSSLPNFERHQLVMVGAAEDPELRKHIRESALSARIHVWTKITDEALCALYSTAEALLFPSLAEGFGWPIIEAQACRCPVVTSDQEPMLEVAGGGAIFVDPRDLSTAPRLIVEGLSQRRKLVDHGFVNSQRFTDHGMLDGYLRAYEEAAASAERRRSS